MRARLIRTGRAARTPARRPPLDAQVVVITGGSRGIGREAAAAFARAGASVVLLARGEAALAETVEEIAAEGGDVRGVVCDVSDRRAVQQAVDRVEHEFGRIDTWVGNAGVLLYAPLADTTPEEFRRILDINVVGQLNGIQAALPALRRSGGSIIVVSSAEAIVAMPLHGAYAASKHAVEGAVDALRRELRAERAPVTITVIRPAVIDTPIYRHARSRMTYRPSGPHPHYRARSVAQAIVYAARRPARTIHVGGGALLLTGVQRVAPGLLDATLGRFGPRMMRTAEDAPAQFGNLVGPLRDTEQRGGLPHRGRGSVTTWLRVHPGWRTAVIVAVLGVVLLPSRGVRR
ncbi:SDR family oxidoreductase [Microbacterium paraoxydans]|uniref:SDR family oxidoreductase n=1 Tax=Microbacterium paraoxydans TaxID=199592 RepID=UPI00217E9E62|nr:SDR family oxidoreductase [Microbacterium paraoxydans]